MKLCVAGAAGAFGRKHLDALANIDAAQVVSVVGGEPDDIDAFAWSPLKNFATGDRQLKFHNW